MRSLAALVVFLISFSPTASFSQSEFLLDSLHIYESSYSTQQLELFQRELHQYDAEGREVVSELYRSDGSNGVFEIKSRDEFTYDNNDNIIQRIEYSGQNQPVQLVPRWLYQFTFNPANLIQEYRFSRWDTDANDWSPRAYQEYFYDANNLQINRIVRQYDVLNDVWEITSQDITEYDQQDRIILILTQDAGNDPNTWVNKSKFEFDYDNANGYEEWSRYEWIDDLWVPTIRNEMDFDANRNIILELRSEWDNGINEWIYDTRTSRIYDNESALTYFQEDDYDAASFQWIPMFKSEWTDNSAYQQESISWLWDELYQDWTYFARSIYNVDDNDLAQTTLEFLWDIGTNDWNQISLEEYFWSGLISGTKKALPEYLRLSPNPVSDFVRVEGVKFTDAYMIFLFDSNGRRIGMWDGNGDAQIDVRDYPKGRYIITILDEDKKYSGIFMKQ